jgi:AcrR family transcriptional regulator
LSTERRQSQRERLVQAVAQLAVRDGLPHVSIAQIVAKAGVSRPTFYEYFTDTDDCFLAAVELHRPRLHEHLRQTLDASSPRSAWEAGARSLIEFGAAEPQLARLLMNEPMAGGPRILAVRDQLVQRLARLIRERQSQAPRTAPFPDFASELLVGGLCRLLAARIRHDEYDAHLFSESLLPWISSYNVAPGKHRWRTLRPMTAPPPWPLLPEMLLTAPAPLTGARARHPEDLRENQRLHILFATAEVTRERGYTASTIAQITQRAGVPRRAFNAMFADKQAAFMAVHELAFARTMAVTASAFFAGDDWPERVWEAGRAFAQFFQSNPTLSHVGFVDAYAVGPAAVKRVEDSHSAFTIFLREGAQNGAGAKPGTSDLALEAIAACVFELGYREARREEGVARMAALLPHTAFLCLAPFLTPKPANRFIDERLASAPGSL